MSEFVFKNLSVKLLPAEGDAPPPDGRECACCSLVVGCGATDPGCGCTRDPCTGSPTCRGCTNNPCTDNPCTNNPCTDNPCTNGPTCGPCTNTPTCDICSRGDSMVGCGCSCADTIDIVSMADAGARSTSDIRTELAAHKDRLRQAIAQVEEEERKLETRGQPQSIEEIDQLKAHFQDAIAELDAHRDRLTAGEEPPPA